MLSSVFGNCFSLLIFKVTFQVFDDTPTIFRPPHFLFRNVRTSWPSASDLRTSSRVHRSPPGSAAEGSPGAAMNGRTVFAVNRSPVLAWNVEPPQPLPYADMPAAAAAISPVVSPADPYARCWQNQVDAGE